MAGTPREIERLLVDWLAGAGVGVGASAGPAVDVDVDRHPTLVVRTSGSSGEPKDVALSRRAVTASATATLQRLGGPGQWVLALPAQYVAGLQVLVRSVRAGTRPVVLADHDGFAAAGAALTHPRRYTAVVPTQLHRILGSPAERAALATFDAVLVGGAAASPELLARARSAGVRLVTTYGMSETAGGCVYDGLPLDGVRVRIDAAGRVQLAGPVLFDGYVAQPALTADVLRDGWLRTPDLGRLDESGRLQIFGRADDVAISGGVNVSLPAVERRLLSHPAIGDAAVVAVADAEWGMQVRAIVVPRAGCEPPSRAELRDFVSAELPREWAPQEVVVVQALPMLASGKVDRQALRRGLVSPHV